MDAASFNRYVAARSGFAWDIRLACIVEHARRGRRYRRQRRAG